MLDLRFDIGRNEERRIELTGDDERILRFEVVVPEGWKVNLELAESDARGIGRSVWHGSSDPEGDGRVVGVIHRWEDEGRLILRGYVIEPESRQDTLLYWEGDVEVPAGTLRNLVIVPEER